MIDWQWSQFSELTVNDLYAVLRLRQEVFVVEQTCVYLDADGLDLEAWHLLAWQGDVLVGYLRVLPAGLVFSEIAIGRVVTAQKVRGQGIGKLLMVEALRKINELFGCAPIRISAQVYLIKFYEEFGFKTVGESYDEDGIEHIQMVRK